MPVVKLQLVGGGVAENGRNRGCTLSAKKPPRARVMYGDYSRVRPNLQCNEPSSKKNLDVPAVSAGAAI